MIIGFPHSSQSMSVAMFFSAAELAAAASPLDHVAPADRALVLRNFAHRRLALLIDRLRIAALAVFAGEEEAVLADAIQHPVAALAAFVRAFGAAGVLDLAERAIDDL